MADRFGQSLDSLIEPSGPQGDDTQVVMGRGKGWIELDHSLETPGRLTHVASRQ